jgi:hypothetical protein
MQGDPDETNTIQMNQVFANCSEEDEIYPLTVKEIVETQKANTKLKHFFKSNAVLDKGLELQLIENKSCICHKGRLVIPKPLQSHAVTTVSSSICISLRLGCIPPPVGYIPQLKGNIAIFPVVLFLL